MANILLHNLVLLSPWILFGTIVVVILGVVMYYRRKKIQSIIFAFIYGKLFADLYIFPHLVTLKKEMFACLKTLSSRDPELKSSNSIRVLEIGIGPGINLKYYPERTRLIAEDPNHHFQSVYKKNRDKFAHVNVERFVHSPAEEMPEIESESIDVVIGTYVLCSVQNCEAVMKEIKRVLVPGGRYIYMEHVRFPNGSWSLTLQKAIEPFWAFFANGCRPTREREVFIKSAGFSSVDQKLVYVPMDLFYPMRPHLIGTAIK